MRTLLFPLFVCAGLAGCGGGPDSPPDADVPQLCEGSCILRVEPQQLVLGLAPLADVDPDQPLWAVHAPLDAAHPEYLSGEARWTSLDPAIAEVDADGVVHPVARGRTWISADYAGERAWAEVTVAGTLERRSLDHDRLRRYYTVYVPESLASPAPLVLSLHGGGGRSSHQIAMSQLNGLSHTHGFLAAYPEGSAGALGLQTWNAGNCCSKAASEGVDDVGFIRKLVADIAGTYAVDERRVYANGMSNGAMMSHRLACEAADLFAAVAAVAGGLNRGGDFAACAPVRPVPILMIHGTTDLIYPIRGGAGSTPFGAPESFYPVVHETQADTLDDWRAINAATGAGRVTLTRGDARCQTYDGNEPVVMCIIDPAVPVSAGEVVYDGGGHAWAGGVRHHRDQADAPSRDVDASAEIWTFFANHPLTH